MKVRVTAFPFAIQFGEIEIPKGADTETYIKRNWDRITFGDVNVDDASPRDRFEYEEVQDE